MFTKSAFAITLLCLVLRASSTKPTAKETLSNTIANAATNLHSVNDAVQNTLKATQSNTKVNLEETLEAAGSKLKDAVTPSPPSMLEKMQERLGLKKHEPTLAEQVEQHISSIHSTTTSGMGAILSAAAHVTEPKPPSTFDKLLQNVGLQEKPSTMTEQAQRNMMKQQEQLKDSANKLLSNLASTQETISNSLRGSASHLASSLQWQTSDDTAETLKEKLKLSASEGDGAGLLTKIKHALGYKTSGSVTDNVDEGLKFAEHSYKHMQEAMKDLNRRVHEQMHAAKEGHTTSFDEVERSLRAKMEQSQTQAEKQLSGFRVKCKELAAKVKSGGGQVAIEVEKERQGVLAQLDEFSTSTGTYALRLQEEAGRMIQESKSKVVDVSNNADTRFQALLETSGSYLEGLTQRLKNFA